MDSRTGLVDYFRPDEDFFYSALEHLAGETTDHPEVMLVIGYMAGDWGLLRRRADVDAHRLPPVAQVQRAIARAKPTARSLHRARSVR
jgi:hypothetical protein